MSELHSETRQPRSPLIPRNLLSPNVDHPHPVAPVKALVDLVPNTRSAPPRRREAVAGVGVSARREDIVFSAETTRTVEVLSNTVS